ncbi:DNA translocase FtsK 4TM domain-containing protein [Candidatus Aerophobetes bacterium]|nr:DNA translocase FtsK 4TM domain-containing protein [Candidatus Aerophobetes bacterium]
MDFPQQRGKKDFILAAIFIIVGLFLLISLLFYRSFESPFFTFPPQSSPKSYIGQVGVFVATYLFLGVGITAFFLPFIFFWMGVKKIKGSLRNFFSHGFGFILFFIGLSSLLYNLGLDITSPWYGGGLLGFFFSSEFVSLFGRLGSWITIGSLLFFSVFLNIDFSIAKEKKRIRKELLPRKRSPTHFSRAKLSEKSRKLSPFYTLPPLSLLNPSPTRQKSSNEVTEAGKKLTQTLKDFGVEVEIEEIKEGPAVIRYEVKLAPGIRVSRLMNLSSDLALSLAVPNVRIEVPVSGKPLVGVEVPKKKVNFVYLRELLEEPQFQKVKGKLFFPLGKDIAGQTIWVNLESLPHLLIGGSTGSGKSVCINSIIISILYRVLPQEVKFLLIDPKTVELVDYANIPHLIFPPIKDVKMAGSSLEWVVQEMMHRYEKFNQKGVRNIAGFNQIQGDTENPLPYLVVIIDELADLMMLSGVRFEKTLCRIAQLGRATGIHLIVATQRPSVDVITGLIKANFPSRISFSVASQIDSRTILDAVGAEKLVGNGDMLYSPVQALRPFRIQGSFISPSEVKRVVGFIREQAEPAYEDIIRNLEEEKEAEEEGNYDELYSEAKDLILARGEASTSLLQRKLSIGYNRAARIMEQLERDGIVGPPRGSKARQVLVERNDEEDKLSQ